MPQGKWNTPLITMVDKILTKLKAYSLEEKTDFFEKLDFFFITKKPNEFLRTI